MGASLEASSLQSLLLDYEQSCPLYHEVNKEHALVLVMRAVTGQNVARFLLIAFPRVIEVSMTRASGCEKKRTPSVCLNTFWKCC